MVAVIVSVPVAVVFPGVSASLSSLREVLQTLSRGDVLFTSARLNLVLSNPEGPPQHEIQRWAARRFLTEPGLRRLQQFARRRGGPKGVHLFSRGQLLELMRWAALLSVDQPDDGNTFQDVVARRRFVEAALIAGELWERRTYASGLSVTADRGADRIRAITPLRAGVDAARTAPELRRALGRSSATYRARLEHHHPGASALFVETTGLTFSQYNAFASTLQIHCGSLTPSSEDIGARIFNSQAVGRALRPEAAEAFPKFLSLESQTPDALRTSLLKPDGSLPGERDAFSLRPLYERPVLCLPDGRGIISDSAIFVEKIALGPLFHLARACRGRAANRMFAAFGACFEEYVQDLLERIWPNLNRNPSRRAPGGQIELGDAAVVANGSLFLFEVKSAFMRDEATRTDSTDGYMAELREKYVGSARDGGKTVAKGVAQLAAALDRIAADGYLASPGDLGGVKRINPVLIVRDGALGSPGHIEFFSRQLDGLVARAVAQRGSADRHPYEIARLTVATVEDVEDIEPSAGAWDVAAYLDAYTREDVNGARPSLRDFMVESQGRYPLYPRAILDTTADEIEEAVRFLYPDATGAPSREP